MLFWGSINNQYHNRKEGSWFMASQEKTYHEQGVIGPCTDDPDFDAVLRIPLYGMSVGKHCDKVQPRTPANPSKT